MAAATDHVAFIVPVKMATATDHVAFIVPVKKWQLLLITWPLLRP